MKCLYCKKEFEPNDSDYCTKYEGCPECDAKSNAIADSWAKAIVSVPVAVRQLLSNNSADDKRCERICCCIPDQNKLDEGCKKPAVYEIWYGGNPSPDDFSDSCAEHLEQLLDDSNTFTINRISTAQDNDGINQTP